MARRKAKTTSDQLDLFQQLAEPPEAAPDLDIHFELLGALNHAIREGKRRGLSRERVVERMNLALPELEKPITLRQLNAWTAASKEYHEFPMRYLPAFCQALESHLPLLALVQALGFELVDARDGVALELGQKLVAQGRLGRDINALRRKLEG